MRPKWKKNLISVSVIVIIIAVWQLLSSLKVIPSFMLPSPWAVVQAFVKDFPLLMQHLKVTLTEAMAGLLLGIAAGIGLAILMDHFEFFHLAFYPLAVLTQTVPTVAIAPLLVLWLGYGSLPKIVLVFLTTFFPVIVNLLDGFNHADKDRIKLLEAMGAGPFQIFRYCKWPESLPAFFSAVRVSTSYAIIGAVIAEWMGGNAGLGVYMMRVKKSYDFDKMFAVIFLISALSFLLLSLLKQIQKLVMPWQTATSKREGRSTDTAVQDK
ncbi:MAG: ABC transporter permease [Eubacteriales bacterium]|nr:ABC transporter permease [Eubacteriales bacterium]